MLSITEEDIKEYQIIDGRIEQAVNRMFAGKSDGLSPFETHYKLITDRQMAAITAYNMMPRQYHHAKWGKAALGFNPDFIHIFEAIINSNPSYCYLSTTNPLPRQSQVMAHAKWAHCDFFANNIYFSETKPESVLSRFAMHANYIDKLVRDPRWGRDAVDYILDAAHAIQMHCGEVPGLEETGKSEKQLRDEITDELSELRQKEKTLVSSFDKQLVQNQIKALERRWFRQPLRPERDLLKFLIDKEMNPHLPDEARNLLSIVREQGRYFAPQAATKIMNEGWATFWQKRLLQQPELDLPFDIGLDLCVCFNSHDNIAINWYFDPYALGYLVWDYIDRKYGFDEGVDKVRVEILGKNSEGRLINTGKYKEVEVAHRNYEKMFQIRREYNDVRFLNEFLNTELFEEINIKALNWVQAKAKKINQVLREHGFGPQVIFDPVPGTLEGLLQAVSTWVDLSETAKAGFQKAGLPLMPINQQELFIMATVLQIVAGYDQDKHLARKKLVLRCGYQWKPNIAAVDTGRVSGGDGVLTLKHTLDPNFGPLKQSECADTLRYFHRLYSGQPIRLLTKDYKRTRDGKSTKELIDYEYFTRDGKKVEAGPSQHSKDWLQQFE